MAHAGLFWVLIPNCCYMVMRVFSAITAHTLVQPVGTRLKTLLFLQKIRRSVAVASDVETANARLKTSDTLRHGRASFACPVMIQSWLGDKKKETPFRNCPRTPMLISLPTRSEKTRPSKVLSQIIRKIQQSRANPVHILQNQRLLHNGLLYRHPLLVH